MDGWTDGLHSLFASCIYNSTTQINFTTIKGELNPKIKLDLNDSFVT